MPTESEHADFRRQQQEAFIANAQAERLPTDGWLPRHSPVVPRSDATVINIVDHGADPTGASDDTAAFQSVLAAATDNCIIYFPTGTYNLHTLITFIGIDGITVQGDGPDRSIIKRHEVYWTDGQAETYANLLVNGTTDPKILRFVDCNSVCVRNIGFDAFGAPTFGGIGIDTNDPTTCYGVNISNTRYFNSDDSEPLEGKDRYAWFLRRTENVWFTNNRVEHLQVEFNATRYVLVENNIFDRSVKSPGIGFLNLASDRTAQFITVRRNYCYNSEVLSMGMITFQLDPPTSTGCIWRDIDILENVLVYKNNSTLGHPAIKLGTSNSSSTTTGNRFERIRIEGNEIYRNPAATIGDSGWNGYIWHAIKTSGGVGGGNGDNLNYSIVRGNRVYTNGAGAGDTRPIVTIARGTTDTTELTNTDNTIHPYKSPPAEPTFPL